MKKLCARLNAWRQSKLFVTAKETRKLHSYYLNRVSDKIRELAEYKQDVARQEQDIMRRCMDLVRAEVEMRNGQTVRYTFEVSHYIMRRKNGQLDKELCQSITRKMIDGLRWAADRQSYGNCEFRQY